MSKPSDEIKMIAEAILSGEKMASAFPVSQMSAILQAIIHHLDINALVAEEKRKAGAGK